MSNSEDPRPDERYRRGLNLLLQRTGGRADPEISKLAEIAPDFARMSVEFALGDLFTRPGIDARARATVAVAALAVLGNASPQLRFHVSAALDTGITRSEVVEILTQISAYAGFPAAINALIACHDLLVEGGDCVSCEPGDGQV